MFFVKFKCLIRSDPPSLSTILDRDLHEPNQNQSTVIRHKKNFSTSDPEFVINSVFFFNSFIYLEFFWDVLVLPQLKLCDWKLGPGKHSLNKFAITPEFTKLYGVLIAYSITGEIGTRSMFAIIIEGLSGIGKTRTAYEMMIKFLHDQLNSLCITFICCPLLDKSRTAFRNLLFCVVEYYLNMSESHLYELLDCKKNLIDILKYWKSHKINSNNTRGFLLLNIDEYQRDSLFCQQLLFDIACWNCPDKIATEPALPELNILIIPIFSGIGVPGVEQWSAFQSSGFVPTYQVLSLSISNFDVLLAEACFSSLKGYNTALKNDYLIKYIALQFNCWPYAFEVLQNIFNEFKLLLDLDVKISLELATLIYNRIIELLHSNYPLLRWKELLGCKASGVKNILALAMSRVAVYRFISFFN